MCLEALSAASTHTVHRMLNTNLHFFMIHEQLSTVIAQRHYWSMTTDPEAVLCQRISLLCHVGNCLGNDMCLGQSIEVILCAVLVDFDGPDFKI